MAGWRYRAEGDGERAGQLGTGGQVWLDALAAGGAVEVGLVGVYGCRWDRDEARVGEPVGMGARCVGVADGAPAAFEVWRETGSAGGAARRAKVWEVAGAVRGGRVEADAPFVFAWPEAEALGGAEGAPPVYVCEVSVGGVHRARGGRLTLRTWFAFGLDDERGKPVAGEPYVVRFADGSAREGRLDRSGRARVDGVPAAVTAVEFPRRIVVRARPEEQPKASSPPPSGDPSGESPPTLPPEVDV